MSAIIKKERSDSKIIKEEIKNEEMREDQSERISQNHTSIKKEIDTKSIQNLKYEHTDPK